MVCVGCFAVAVLSASVVESDEYNGLLQVKNRGHLTSQDHYATEAGASQRRGSRYHRRRWFRAERERGYMCHHDRLLQEYKNKNKMQCEGVCDGDCTVIVHFEDNGCRTYSNCDDPIIVERSDWSKSKVYVKTSEESFKYERYPPPKSGYMCRDDDLIEEHKRKTKEECKGVCDDDGKCMAIAHFDRDGGCRTYKNCYLEPVPSEWSPAKIYVKTFNKKNETFNKKNETLHICRKDAQIKEVRYKDLQKCAEECGVNCAFIVHFEDNGCHTYRSCDALTAVDSDWATPSIYEKTFKEYDPKTRKEPRTRKTLTDDGFDLS